MKTYYVDYMEFKTEYYFMIRDKEDMSILPLPTKYLKHKMKSNCSPNTVRRIAYALSYYLNFLEEENIRIKEVFKLSYMEQHEHFTKYLYWLKAGNHKGTSRTPNNNTCNAYLNMVFGFYQFLLLEYDIYDNLKIFNDGKISYQNAVGVRFTKSVKVFGGYLPSEESHGKSIEKENLIKLIEGCDHLRDRLLLLLIANTGFRIGEILGILYTKDIDFDTREIRVTYRSDNANRARAKNAENRSLQISEGTFEILQYYLSENRELLKDTDYLFINLHGKTKGKPMTINGVYSVLKTLEKRTGIKATPHMLRHYFANERRAAGWDLLLIAKALGHKHISTTEAYLDVRTEELCDATNEFYEKNMDLYRIDDFL
ncbi:MAG: tyrosine-type recombinase/integrase [Lachnospiraceae bacterium]|nr:tyrosine-type recombinase/integrase [Lachnospiraceae bacterium]